MYTIKIVYSKGEEVKYISHLDLIRVLERAIRRAELPMVYSQGFNPRMKISYRTRALKVGETSDACEAELNLENFVASDQFKERLNHTLPKGIRIINADTSNCA